MILPPGPPNRLSATKIALKQDMTSANDTVTTMKSTTAHTTTEAKLDIPEQEK